MLKIMVRVLVLAIGLFLASPTLAADAYLCIATMANGFAYNKVSKDWYPTQFNVINKKYLLKRGDLGWVWAEFGVPNTLEQPCGHFNDFGFLNCPGLEEIVFNKETLRYQLVYAVEYVLANKTKNTEGDNTPHIEIGTCSAL